MHSWWYYQLSFECFDGRARGANRLLKCYRRSEDYAQLLYMKHDFIVGDRGTEKLKIDADDSLWHEI